MTVTTAVDARAELMDRLTAKWTVPVIAALAELGVADHVTDGPRGVRDLAELVGVDPRSLYRVLRAAASIGLFVEEADGRFGATPVSECLRSDVQGSLRPAARMFGHSAFWDPYSEILHSVRTGAPAFDKVFSTSIYEFLGQHDDAREVFGAAAAAFHAEGVDAIVRAHDFNRYQTVVDVGGGSGSLLGQILLANPGVRGVLFDVAAVVPAAERHLAELGIADRVDLIAGDFFAAVPSGDALLIKSCLHNLSDDQVSQVLEVIRAAVPRDGVLLLAETVVPPGNGPHYSKWDDIEMLVVAGGVDRSEREWTDLLHAGGFEPRSVTACGERFSLMECVPV